MNVTMTNHEKPINHHFINLRNNDLNIDSMITIYNTSVTDTTSVILEKERR